MNNLPVTIPQSLAAPSDHLHSPTFLSPILFICLSVFSFLLYLLTAHFFVCLYLKHSKKAECATLFYRSGSQWCEHKAHVTHSGAWHRGNEFLSQPATYAHTPACRSIFNKKSVVQKQRGWGELFVYVRAHVCLKRALQWARTIIRVVTEKTQNTVPMSEYVGAAACAPDRREEDQLVIRTAQDHMTGELLLLCVERRNTTIGAKCLNSRHRS